MSAGPLSRYLRLRNDFANPLKALLFSYKLLKGKVQLTTKEGLTFETNKDDLPIWMEYFSSKKVQVDIVEDLFRVTPRDGSPAYLVAGANYKITYRPQRYYPSVLNCRLFAELESSERKVFSQHGEDGVIEEIFKRIQTPHRFVVEFGAHDGVKMSNSRNLIKNHSWRGFLIEADPRLYKDLARVYADSTKISIMQTYVTEENINQLFCEAGVPKDFELLSIDVDSIDYYLWKSLSDFRPRLVIVECNPVFPPDQDYVVEKESAFRLGGTRWEGASFQSFVKLAQEKSYTLVYVELIGSNLFFVANEYLDQLGVIDVPADKMYQPPQFGEL
ncbi:MAG TPA: hypothetical protein PLU50_10510, partial [Pseudobdellovibrionaceae bacterium]|nr:hypothetical protein [Pseudobdellovibrionaceae bacterium]